MLTTVFNSECFFSNLEATLLFASILKNMKYKNAIFFGSLFQMLDTLTLQHTLNHNTLACDMN